MRELDDIVRVMADPAFKPTRMERRLFEAWQEARATDAWTDQLTRILTTARAVIADVASLCESEDVKIPDSVLTLGRELDDLPLAARRYFGVR